MEEHAAHHVAHVRGLYTLEQGADSSAHAPIPPREHQIPPPCRRTRGYQVGSEAPAGAALDHEAAEAGTAGTANKGVGIYQLTEDGLFVHAALDMKKFCPDTKLNED